jgi:cardiolipin synthase
MNLPNILTLLRILLVPAILLLLARGGYGPALWLVLVAGVTDFLDGYIARRFNLTTHLGAVLDPLADKVLVVCSVVVLAWLDRVPWWLALAIVGRDLVILAGAGAWYRKAGHLRMEPTLLSKINTFVQVALVNLVIAHAAGLLSLAAVLPGLFALALATTLVSGAQYVVVWGRRARAL